MLFQYEHKGIGILIRIMFQYIVQIDYFSLQISKSDGAIKLLIN